MRRRRVAPVASFHMLACAALLALCAPGSAAAQQVTLSGVVREAGGDGSAVPSAAVHVMDGPGTTTDAQGRFTLPRVQPGSLQLVVQAFGYRTRTLDIVLRGDTAIVVELETSAVGLDSLVAEARTFPMVCR